MSEARASGRLDGKKFAVVTNIPTPYRIPLLAELSRQAAAAGAELTVVFAARGYPRRQWDIDLEACEFCFEILDDAPAVGAATESPIFGYRGLGRALARIGPDVVLVAGFSAATLRLWAQSWWGYPYIIWSGAISSPHRPVSWLRQLQRRLLMRRSIGGVAYGSRAKDYLVELGASPDSVHIAMNTVDTAFFVESSDRARELGSERGGRQLLYVGHLTVGKRIDRLFEALAELQRRGCEATLTIVGDGPERGNLESLAQRLGLTDRVRFEGFRQKQEIPSFLARSDVFLFPSDYDVWGLVLVEAMLAALPCLSSPNAGATVDLIEEGITGFRDDFAKTVATADRIESLLLDPDRCRQIGLRARGFVLENLTLERSAASMLNALAAATGARQEGRLAAD